MARFYGIRAKETGQNLNECTRYRTGIGDCVAVVARRFARLFRPPLEGVSSARYGLTHGAAGWTPFFMAQTSPQGPSNNSISIVITFRTDGVRTTQLSV